MSTKIAIFIARARASIEPARPFIRNIVLLFTLIVGAIAVWGALTLAVQPTFAETPAVSQVASAPDCDNDWVVVPSPNPGAAEHFINGIAAISSNDVWAVGGYYNVGAHQTLIEHWNGTTWSVVSSPNPGIVANELQGVTAISASDVWAVGHQSDSSGFKTLIVHWNGSSWSAVTSPSPGLESELNGVTATSASDVWAVGEYFDGTNEHTLTLHWSGLTWVQQSSPDAGTSENYLYGVDAKSASDVWAVGNYDNGAGSVREPLTLHWNGSSWTVVSSPGVGANENYLYGVTAISSSDAWAVGDYNDSAGGVEQTLTLHWNGSAWSVVTSPNVGREDNYLYGATAVSGSDMWAVGYYENVGVPQALILHWNGSAWSAVSSPDISSGDNFLYGVAAVSSTDVWAAGYYADNTATPLTLIEHYNPCPTTPTPTPGPTICAIEFSDVPSGSTFYTYIECLACNGIVSGYSDGTFRPNNDVTRGQIAKIVANAAGYAEAHPEQTFQDVPVGSTFHDFIERLASRAIINGYPCGGPGEPCVGPDNKPYFRPGSNTTRGQLSKIVCLAYGCSDTIAVQSFEDVPPTHTFYEYIEALHGLGAINGYPCGGPGEPCVGPDNRPYFRPGALVTRGQTSKIVSSVFFPSCGTDR